MQMDQLQMQPNTIQMSTQTYNNENGGKVEHYLKMDNMVNNNMINGT